MCLFSQSVLSVAGTRIFARGNGDTQLLAYAMTLHAEQALAMVLPLPVPAGSAADALSFIDLSQYSELFDDLAKGFPVPASRSLQSSFGSDLTLEVHTVGAFEASYVPSPKDFDRLDARFRLDPSVLRALPGYADWGFAVFKLAASRSDSKVHPMAFSFPRRDRRRLFFPTVHVHDGSVPKTARFDHKLYAQFDAAAPVDWWPSTLAAAAHVDTVRARGLVEPAQSVASRGLYGERPNVDTWA